MEHLMKSALKPVVAASAVLLACATPALSRTKQCSENRCGLSIAALDATTKKPVLTFTVLINKDKSAPAAIAILPLGVALAPGVKLVIGDAQIALAYKVCVPDGCQAYADLSAEDWTKITAAKSVQVRFFPLASDKPVSSELDMAGLGDELSKL
jgi:invasion protein IalB